MFQVITLNLNGIRSAAKKGCLTWLLQQKADVICVQEIRAQAADLDATFQLAGYESHFHFANKKGYSGVGIYTKHKPKCVKVGLGFDHADLEGRYVEIDLGKFSIASLYMPSGTSGDVRQSIKYAFLDAFADHLRELKARQQDYIICGDWNIAHKEIDLKNWRSNQKNSGFLPEERAWMDMIFTELGYVDAFREVNPHPEQYTWWSNRGRAREKNVGWRIDYQIITPGLKSVIKSANIYTLERFSDHAPLCMNYDIIV